MNRRTSAGRRRPRARGSRRSTRAGLGHLEGAASAPYRDVDMYDVDGFETKKGNVGALHAAGIKASCYLSAG